MSKTTLLLVLTRSFWLWLLSWLPGLMFVSSEVPEPSSLSPSDPIRGCSWTTPEIIIKLLVKSMENALSQNRWNSLPCTVARQRSCNQRVGCLLYVTWPNTPGFWTEKEGLVSLRYPWLLFFTFKCHKQVSLNGGNGKSIIFIKS